MKKRFSFGLVVFITVFLFCFWGCEKPAPSFRFVFLTDVHLTPDHHGVEGLLQAIQRVNALSPRPDFVITGGDLVMDAREQSQESADSLYALYMESIQHFEMPVYNTIGNHEFFGVSKNSGVESTHPLFGEKMFLQYMDAETPYTSFDFQNWHFVLLNSVGQTPDGHYFGRVDSLQLEWLKRDLFENARGKTVALALHIPLYSVAMQMSRGPLAANRQGLVVTNAQEVMSVLEPYDVRLVLQGHLHIVEEIVWKNTHFITGGAVCGAWWEGPRQGFEEGFVVVDVSGREFAWHYEDYGWEARE